MSAIPQISRPTRDSHPGESLWVAAAEVLTAGQQLILDRLDLLRAELAGEASQVGNGMGLLAAGVAVLALAWAIGCAALCALLLRVLPADAALAVVAALNLGVSTALIAAGLRRVRPAHG